MSAQTSSTYPAPIDQPFRIGNWLADPRANTLSEDGTHHSVEPKVMDLLTLLAAAPGRTFFRDELDEALWPDMTVGEDSLARLVSKLRRALQDDPARPAYIETIPKRGYRLISPVELIADAPSHTSSVKKRPLLWSAAGLAILLIGAMTFWFWTAERATSPAASMTERADDLYMQMTRADNEAAIELYERAIDVDPDYARAQAGLANALVQRVIRWQSPPGQSPSAVSLREALSNGVTQTGNADALLARAIDLGERAVRLAPRDADALKSLGFAYSARNDLDQAKDIYSRAAELDPDAWEVMVNLGELSMIEGDMAQAIVWFEKAYAAMDRLYTAEPQRIGPWHASLGILIGEAYEGAGELEKAADWYRLVLEQTPFEPEATIRLIRVLRVQSHSTEADLLCRELTKRISIDRTCSG